MKYVIINANTADLPLIYQLFEEAILFQKENSYIGWTSYDREFIQSDIRKGLLFKMTDRENVVAVFSICLSDPLIWRDRENGDALYLHRLVLNRQFKGAKIFHHVLSWATGFARSAGLGYIRMDTWAANDKLISYYKSYGFSFIENHTTGNTEDLPEQYRNLHVALLELPIERTGVQLSAAEQEGVLQLKGAV